MADVAEVVAAEPMLGVVEQVAGRLRFHHWELRFAEVFAGRGGFDLILGNPPWIKLQWNESGVLGDGEPRLVIRGLSAPEVAKGRAEMLTAGGTVRANYLEEFADMQGTQAFLNDLQNYPLLKGVQTNLYKCFLAASLWELSPRGISGLIHQDGFYNDPKGGNARAGIIPQICLHLHFSNKKRLFQAIKDEKHFEFTIVARVPRRRFVMLGNVFHPLMIDQSFTHDGRGEVPGIKNEQGDWDLRGHRSRVIHVDEKRMQLFAALLDEPGTPPWQARLPVLMSEQLVTVLEKFSSQPRRLGDLHQHFYATVMFDETGARKNGTIREENRYAKHLSELIYQGPHFFVGNPLYQTPNEGCSHNQDYSSLDLGSIPTDYLPRTNYVPACDAATYRSRTPEWNGKPVTDYFRLIHRRQLASNGERTLITSIMPPGPGHVHTCVSTAFDDARLMVTVASLFASIPFDYFLRCSGRNDLTTGNVGLFPLPDLDDSTRSTLLRLMCLTQPFAKLWESLSTLNALPHAPPLGDRRSRFRPGSSRFSNSVGLRNHFERREALIAIDVAAAKALGMSLLELQTLYRTQFPVLDHEYERVRLYDQHGRIVPTATTSNGSDCINLVALAKMLKEHTDFDIHREYHPGAPETDELLSKRIKLSPRDAAVLQASERCTVADLMATTEVRWSSPDHPEGRLVPLVGLRYTDPGLEPRKQRIYPTPWTRHSREADYAQAWSSLAT